MQTTLIDVKKLAPNTGQIPGLPKNPRLIKNDRFKKLVKSMQDDPEMLELRELIVMAWDGVFVVIAGNQRLGAGKEIGHKKMPCKVLPKSTPVEKLKAIAIKDNVSHGEHDWDLLANEWDAGKLADWGLEIDFDPAAKAGKTDPDDAPPAPVKAKTKLGQLYQLGDHRLMCGDSTNTDVVQKLMGGGLANMVFTDPPYGVDFQQGKFIGRHKRAKENRNFSPIANDELKADGLTNFLLKVLSNAAVVSDVCAIYVWSPPMEEGFAILKSIRDSGWHVQSQIVWNKSPFVMGQADYHWKHEICWYGYKGKKHQWHGGRDKSTIWDVSRTMKSDLHPTMKPVELAQIACQNSTKPDDIVLDLFGGSGSTLIACETNGRKCYTMELDPKYCDVIVKRWEDFTGKKAELVSG